MQADDIDPLVAGPFDSLEASRAAAEVLRWGDIGRLAALMVGGAGVR